MGDGWREGVGKWLVGTACVVAALFLVGPILVVLPLSFNAEPYFTFTEGMLRLDPEAWSVRWYRQLAEGGWLRALGNSVVIGAAATALATVLGTCAALGLASPHMPGRGMVMALVVSPMVTPVIILSVGLFFFYSEVGIAQTYVGLILAHAVLGAPLVVITVTASLAGFDPTLLRAAAGLGAGPLRSFFRVQLPVAGPGIATGSIFAFVASLDEIAVVLLVGGVEHRTIPREMWSSIREQASPTLLAAAAVLTLAALLMLITVEWLQRRAASGDA